MNPVNNNVNNNNNNVYTSLDLGSVSSPNLDPLDPMGAALAGINTAEQQQQKKSQTVDNSNSAAAVADSDDSVDTSDDDAPVTPVASDDSGSDSTIKGLSRMRRVGSSDQQAVISQINSK